VGRETAVDVPRTLREGVHPVEEDGGGETFGIGVVGEAVADGSEELKAGLEMEGGFVFKDGGEGLTGPGGPFTSHHVGELEQRLAQILAAGREVGRKVFFGIRRELFQTRQSLLGPGKEALLQRLGVLCGLTEMKPLYPIPRCEGFENDWEGAVG
jgi:hypothetical protein